MVLHTPRLTLRKWTPADAPRLFELASDPEVGPSTGWPPHKSVEESAQVLARFLSGPECYAICRSGRPIGSIELMLGDAPQLGFWLGRPYWGRGYMTEAAAALCERGFRDLDLPAIGAGWFLGNDRSRRVQEKLGFLYQTTRENVPFPQLGETRTCCDSILTRQRWEERNK